MQNDEQPTAAGSSPDVRCVVLGRWLELRECGEARSLETLWREATTAPLEPEMLKQLEHDVEIILRDDGGSWDLGYPRVIQHEPGKCLAVYYMNRKDDPIQQNGGVRHIAQTVFTPE